jgi:hypothetical protein
MEIPERQTSRREKPCEARSHLAATRAMKEISPLHRLTHRPMRIDRKEEWGVGASNSLELPHDTRKRTRSIEPALAAFLLAAADYHRPTTLDVRR